MSAVSERVLFVHAHPDDETISTGGTIAVLVARGAHVTVITCTRGERGEVIPPALAHLEGSGAELALRRERELEKALGALGVSDHRYLGSDRARWSGNPVRTYRDSGMKWGLDGAEPADTVDDFALTKAEFGEVAADIAAVIADVQPDAVISYDSNGGYGHPDHIVAHEASRRAAEIMGVAFYAIETGAGVESASATGLANDLVVVDVREVLDKKRAALMAHETQLTVVADTFTLSNGVVHEIASTETYRRVRAEYERGQEPPETSLISFGDYSLLAKILTVGATASGSVFAGLILTAIHQAIAVVAGVTVPLGLIVAILGTTALLAGLRISYQSRIPAAVAACAVLGATAVLSAPTPGGSLVVPANLVGYLWSYGATLVAFVVLAWPRVLPRVSTKLDQVNVVKGSSTP
jgi:N-acetyl-1-D-myo-inositol-2-amino-2-deoxy-alpha-D-glucopyranoside deacetylase